MLFAIVVSLTAALAMVSAGATAFGWSASGHGAELTRHRGCTQIDLQGHLGDAESLRPAARSTDGRGAPRVRAGGPGACALAMHVAPVRALRETDQAEPVAAWLRSEPPTRGRARLMVFHN
jgi:hypothetical protein